MASKVTQRKLTTIFRAAEVAGDDLLSGDGVNVAARLGALPYLGTTSVR